MKITKNKTTIHNKDKPINRYKVKKSTQKNVNPVEKWLKTRFREGFAKLKSSFEEIDIHKTGSVINKNKKKKINEKKSKFDILGK